LAGAVAARAVYSISAFLPGGFYMRWSIRSLFISAWILVLLTGCGTQNVNSNIDVQTKTVDGLVIALEAPKVTKLLDTASFLITLTDATGKPVEGADVYLELLMPAMPMGTNKPVATVEGPGKYRAQGVFDMIGDWQVTVHANVEGKDHAAMFISKVEEK
jgi:hypothetical protein